MSDKVLYERQGVLGYITLNRPEKLNAIDGDMVALLHQAMDEAERDDAVRAIVLCGAGRAFSSGFDLKMSTPDGTRDVAALRRELRRDFDVIMRFWDSPKPTLALVHGYCLGSGMEMALACDLTVAARDCRFGAPEVRFGSGIVCLILPWLVGPKLAKQLLLTGEDRVAADEAMRLGLVNCVVDPESLADAGAALARSIAVNDALAVRLTKQAINRSFESGGMRNALLQALELDVLIEATETAESRAFAEVLARDGAKAAIAWRDARLAAGTGPGAEGSA